MNETFKEMHIRHDNEIKEHYARVGFTRFKSFRSIIDSRDPFASFKCETIAGIKELLTELKPHIGNFEIEYKAEKISVNRPYRIKLASNFTGVEARIEYKTKEYGIWITFPANLISDFIKLYERHPCDTEHHYFTGMTVNQINKQIIMAARFNYGQLDYYGGYKTLIEEAGIDKIISYILGNKKEK